MSWTTVLRFVAQADIFLFSATFIPALTGSFPESEVTGV
jgi:hypothetical protein